MRPSHRPRFLALAAALAFFPGCAGTGSGPKPRFWKTVTLTGTEKQTLVTVFTGTELKIVLPAPGPGQSWELASNNGKVMRQTSFFVSVPGANGAPGATTITFYSEKRGRSVIRCILRHDGTADDVGGQMYEIAVGVKELDD